MSSAIRMWNNTRMIILVAVCAAIYGSALIAFKTAIPLIPGITEVRVANIFPMVFGLLFWSCRSVGDGDRKPHRGCLWRDAWAWFDCWFCWEFSSWLPPLHDVDNVFTLL
ncbi:MAG: hypothetical protein ACPL6D_11090 [Thermodesulfobacteriota bacterium]